MSKSKASVLPYADDGDAAVAALMERVRASLDLPKKQTRLFCDDYINILKYYEQQGLAFGEAEKRIAPERYGAFYKDERVDWYPLDHAAKVYPLSMSLGRMMVFRVSCVLKEAVVAPVLQMALNLTVPRFPYFATTIKCGFFWHYMDGTKRRYRVRPETKLPCSVMQVNAYNSASFRVIYFENRFSVEFFHIQTDGTGAMIFLKTLLGTYLGLLGVDVPATDGLFDIAQKPDPKEWSDDFVLADEPETGGSFADKRAIQLSGVLPFESPNRVLHFNMSVQELRAKAKAFGVSMTVLMLGYLFLVCKQASPKNNGKRKFQIQLPVNMRKFYPSQTLRNFSMYCSIRLKPSQITTLEEMLPEIASQVALGTSKAQLDQTIAAARKLVKYLRFVPLIVKRPIAYFIYGALGDGVFTTTLSNLGSIALPQAAVPYVDKFDFVLGPPTLNRAEASFGSFGDKAVLTITKNTQNESLENALYALLISEGLSIMVEGSE